MNFTDGQTYTFTDFRGDVATWTRTRGVWVSPEGYAPRDDSYIAAVREAGHGELS